MKGKNIKLNVLGFEVGQVYSIQLGNYNDRYLVISVNTDKVFQLKRVRIPETKIDGVRLPENVFISYFSSISKN